MKPIPPEFVLPNRKFEFYICEGLPLPVVEFDICKKYFPYYVNVGIKKVSIAMDMRCWVVENLSGIWACSGTTCFHFESEMDAIHFKLRWVG